MFLEFSTLSLTLFIIIIINYYYYYYYYYYQTKLFVHSRDERPFEIEENAHGYGKRVCAKPLLMCLYTSQIDTSSPHHDRFRDRKLLDLLIYLYTSSARGFARIKILFKKIYCYTQAVCFSGHWQKCVLSYEQLQSANCYGIKKGRPSWVNEDSIELKLL